MYKEIDETQNKFTKKIIFLKNIAKNVFNY